MTMLRESKRLVFSERFSYTRLPEETTWLRPSGALVDYLRKFQISIKLPITRQHHLTLCSSTVLERTTGQCSSYRPAPSRPRQRYGVTAHEPPAITTATLLYASAPPRAERVSPHCDPATFCLLPDYAAFLLTPPRPRKLISNHPLQQADPLSTLTALGAEHLVLLNKTQRPS